MSNTICVEYGIRLVDSDPILNLTVAAIEDGEGLLPNISSNQCRFCFCRIKIKLKIAKLLTWLSINKHVHYVAIHGRPHTSHLGLIFPVILSDILDLQVVRAWVMSCI